jgi:hypothetical protein
MAKQTKTTRPRNGTKSASRAAKPKTASKAKPSQASSASRKPTEEQIRSRAYEIFLARNGTQGDPLADWLQAKNELEAGLKSD